jgi:import receptor subunit TOM22
MVEVEEVDARMEEIDLPADANAVEEDDYEDVSSGDDEEDVNKGLTKTTSGKAEASDDEEEDDILEDESLLERLSALVDIVPPVARAKAWIALSDAGSFSWSLAQMAGSGLWILSTGLLLTLLPVALELERERAVIDQEQQQRIQQQQAQQVFLFFKFFAYK